VGDPNHSVMAFHALPNTNPYSSNAKTSVVTTT
jgi:hypothetical protein